MSLIQEVQPMIDPRTPLATLRRTQLQKILRKNEVLFDVDASAEALRLIVEGKNLDYMAYFNNPASFERPITSMTDLTTPEDESKTDYSGMKRHELMKLCKEKSIPVVNTDKVDTLIEKLNGAD